MLDGMKQLMGVILLGVLALALSACGVSGNAGPAAIPGAQLAPVTSVTGVLPEYGNQYGVLTYMASGWQTHVSFLEPFITTEFGPDGAFTFALPETAPALFVSDAVCGHEGQAAVAGLYALASEPVAGEVPAEDVLESYRLEFEGGFVLFWYSPEAGRPRCVTESGSLTGGGSEDWDLRLAKGWNTVLAYEREGAWVLRTGVAPGASWVRFPNE